MLSMFQYPFIACRSRCYIRHTTHRHELPTSSECQHSHAKSTVLLSTRSGQVQISDLYSKESPPSPTWSPHSRRTRRVSRIQSCTHADSKNALDHNQHEPKQHPVSADSMPALLSPNHQTRTVAAAYTMSRLGHDRSDVRGSRQERIAGPDQLPGGPKHRNSQCAGQMVRMGELQGPHAGVSSLERRCRMPRGGHGLQ